MARGSWPVHALSRGEPLLGSSQTPRAGLGVPFLMINCIEAEVQMPLFI